MKKLLFVIIFNVAWIFLVAKFYAEPKAKELIEKNGSNVLGSPLHVGSVHIVFWPPLSVEIKDLSGETASPVKTKFEIQSVLAQLSLPPLIKKETKINVVIRGPKVTSWLPESQKSNSSNAPAAPSAPNAPQGEWAFEKGVKFSVNVSLIDGELAALQGTNNYQMKKLMLNFNLYSLDQPYRIDLTSQTYVQHNGMNFNFPVKLLSNFTYKANELKTSETRMDIAGFDMALAGASQFQKDTHKWDIYLLLPELNQLPVPPAFLPPGKWSGKLSSRMHLEKFPGAEPHVYGDFKAINILGKLKYNQNQIIADGQLAANADVDFEFKDKEIKFQKMVVSGELKDLALKYQDKLDKPLGIPMNFSINAAEANQILTIQNANFVFDKIVASANGHVSTQTGEKSDLNLTVPRTNLAGLERYFPVLAKEPMQGFVELKSNISGDLKNPKALNISVNPIKLDNVRAKVQWTSEDKHKSISGPAAINASAIFVVHGTQIGSAKLDGKMDFSNMDIKFEDKLEKRARVPLSLVISARQLGDVINFSQSSIFTSAGQLIFKGTVKNPQVPIMNLDFKIPSLDFIKLAELVPMLKAWKIGGKADATANLKGQFDPSKGIEKSPLQLSASVNANIPNFEYHSKAATTETNSTAPKAAGAGGAPHGSSSPAKAKPEPLLPNWPIARSLAFKSTLKMGTINFNNLQIKGVSWAGGIQSGTLSGNAKIENIFAGQVQAKNIKMSLVEATPTTYLQAQGTGLDMAEALKWATPQWKDLASGKVSGNMDLSVASSDRPDFIQATKVIGDVKIQDGYLSTLQFDQYVNKKLSGIPGIGNKNNVSTKGVKSDIDSKFDFSNSVLTLKTFHVKTPEKNELQSSGWIKVDKTMDLKGTVFLSDAPIQGDVRAANSDPSGRLMLPVHFTGNVMSPEFNIADETVKQLVSKTASYAGEKLKKQVQEQATKQIQKQLQDTAKKQLQDLFGH